MSKFDDSDAPDRRRRAMLVGIAGLGLEASLRGVGAAERDDTQPGLILAIGGQGGWDSAQLSCPRVLRVGADDWRMWYYGRDPEFNPQVRLPSGRIGLAVSSDGRQWQRVRGPATRGAIMDPAQDATRFDSAHVGVSDVQQTDEGFEMWYFGGPRNLQTLGELEFDGFPLRIGRATSADGIHWRRDVGPFMGAQLDHGAPGEPDAFMVGWPQVVRMSGGDRRMYYHSYVPATNKFIVCAAESEGGGPWRRLGQVLGPGEAGAFDADGAGTRHVIHDGKAWWMIYEGFLEQRASIGLARSDDGLVWTRVPGQAPGGAVFAPRTDAAGAWDGGAVGTPWLLPTNDGRWLMYYVGAGNRADAADLVEAEASAVHQIGLAVSDSDDFMRWTRWRS